MRKAYGVARRVSSMIESAAERALESYRDGRVEQEPALTDRLLARIEDALDGVEDKGIRWTAKTLTDRGRGAQEARVGADFAGVLELDLEDYHVRKGFLAQAKRVEPSDTYTAGSWNDLRRQCMLMLGHSPVAFVFLYAREEIRIISASAVVAQASPVNPHALYSRSIKRFYEEHITSFIGDPRISAPSQQLLDRLRETLDLRAILMLQGVSGDERSDDDWELLEPDLLPLHWPGRLDWEVRWSPQREIYSVVPIGTRVSRDDD